LLGDRPPRSDQRAEPATCGVRTFLIADRNEGRSREAVVVSLAAAVPPRAARWAAAERWAGRVAANAAQVARLRESVDPADFYASRVRSFQSGGYPATEWPRLLALLRPGDTWIDVGAGAGRLAVPLAGAVRQVVAVEPSESMRRALESGLADRDRANVRIIDGRWPQVAAKAGRGEVALAAFVVFDQPDIVGFLEAMERAARRRVVVSVTNCAPSAGDDELWWELHGEPQASLPAAPELTEVLAETGRPFTLTTLTNARGRSLPFEAAIDKARRTYWVARGTAKDRRLAELLRERHTSRYGRVRLPGEASTVSVFDWAPR
jgi:hypothetical protein